MAAAAEGELAAVENDRDVFPPAFRGKWARDHATCDDPDGKGSVRITAGRISSYESDAVLLKHALIFQAAPDGREAATIIALVARSGEGELGIDKLRISRVADRLYQSDADAKTEDWHWRYPNLRCAG